MAALEIRVQTRAEEALQDYYPLELRYNDGEAVSAEVLSADWNQPRLPPSTQALGDRCLLNATACCCAF